MSFEVPDACTLPTVERPLRLAAFDELFATAVRRVERVSEVRARLDLVGPPGLAAAVQDLTDREAECCSFFTFTLASGASVEGEVVTLDVEVPARYAEVLKSLAERAVTVSVGGRP